MDTPSILGIKKIYSVEFVVDDFDRSRSFYVGKMGFAETHRSQSEWESRFRSKALYFSANDIKLMISSPLSSSSYTAQYLKILCPGIRRVTFQVKNLDEACRYLKDHHVTFVHRPIEIESRESIHRLITIATPIGFLEFSFLEIEGDEEDIPMFEKIGTVDGTRSPFNNIDHMTINARTIYPIYSFFEHVMDLKKFWSVSFHTPDHKSGKKGTGLSSQVMYDPASEVKFASNEPLYPHFNESQIQTFVERNHGAGIQHAALAVDDIVSTVEQMKSRGIEFLDTPEEYYNLLPGRLAKQNIHELKENIEDLRRLAILVDGQDGNYLLQIFLKDASVIYHEEKAGPFFYEIIQRRGHPGFGEGNFRALFEAIELQESAQ